MKSKNYIVEVKNSFTLNKIKFSNWINYDCVFIINDGVMALISRKDGKQIEISIETFTKKFKFSQSKTDNQ